jgi:hypothetical protein
MLTVDGAFDRIGSVLRDKGYTVAKEENPSDSGDRVALFKSPDMSVRVCWDGKARLLALQIDDAEGGWVDFARLGFGPKGLEESAVDALVRKVGNEVGETSTDSD